MRRRPLTLFVVQQALDASWTPLFFGLHRPGLVFLDIALLWMAIVATLVAFWRVHRGAAWMLALYLARIGFASVPNFTLWRMIV